MIQQFQPTNDSPINIESEPVKSMNNNKLSDAPSEGMNSRVQMPYTIITKVTPTTDDKNMNNHDRT